MDTPASPRISARATTGCGSWATSTSGGAEAMHLAARSVVNCAGLTAPSLGRSIAGYPADKAPPEFYAKGIVNGYFTRNEVRRWENLNRIEGLDVPLMALNLGPGVGEPEDEDPVDDLEDKL